MEAYYITISSPHSCLTFNKRNYHYQGEWATTYKNWYQSVMLLD